MAAGILHGVILGSRVVAARVGCAGVAHRDDLQRM